MNTKKSENCRVYCLAIQKGGVAGFLCNSEYCEKTETITTTRIYESNELITLQDNNISSGKYVGISVYGNGAATGRVDTKKRNCTCWWVFCSEWLRFKQLMKLF
ncbi:MAG: hypothetical protein K1V95_01740 [Eubacterium sp.]